MSFNILIISMWPIQYGRMWRIDRPTVLKGPSRLFFICAVGYLNYIDAVCQFLHDTREGYRNLLAMYVSFSWLCTEWRKSTISNSSLISFIIGIPGCSVDSVPYSSQIRQPWSRWRTCILRWTCRWCLAGKRFYKQYLEDYVSFIRWTHGAIWISCSNFAISI